MYIKIYSLSVTYLYIYVGVRICVCSCERLYVHYVHAYKLCRPMCMYDYVYVCIRAVPSGVRGGGAGGQLSP